MTGPNVTIHDDGSATVSAPTLRGTWTVFEQDDVWVARSERGGYLTSPRNPSFKATFRSRGEVLQALGVEVPA